MMPVDGEKRARWTARAGSIARASASLTDYIRHAVRLGLGFDLGEPIDFRLAPGHQKLAAPAVRNAIVSAELIEHGFAADAQASLIEVARVIDACVDHFAVARADPRTDAILALDNNDLASGPRKSSSGRETDDTGSDNEAIDKFK